MTSALTFAVEAYARSSSNGDEVRAVLIPMLQDKSAVLREGVIYGLSHHLDGAVVAVLERMAAHDPSAGVRQAASDILDEWRDKST